MGINNKDNITVAQAIDKFNFVHLVGLGGFILSWAIGLSLLFIFDQFDQTIELKPISFFFFFSSFLFITFGYLIAFAHWFVWAYNKVDHPLLLTRLAVVGNMMSPPSSKLNKLILPWGLDRSLYKATWEKIMKLGSLDALIEKLPEDRIVEVTRKRSLLNWKKDLSLTFTPEALIINSEAISWKKIPNAVLAKEGDSIVTHIAIKDGETGKWQKVNISKMSLPYQEVDRLMMTYIILYSGIEIP